MPQWPNVKRHVFMIQRRVRALVWTSVVVRGVSPELQAIRDIRFVDAVPAEFQKQRRGAANSVLKCIGGRVRHHRSMDPAVVESILGRFNDSVVNATVRGERINPVSLHRSLHEAIVSKHHGRAPSITGLVAAGGYDGADAVP